MLYLFEALEKMGIEFLEEVKKIEEAKRSDIKYVKTKEQETKEK